MPVSLLASSRQSHEPSANGFAVGVATSIGFALIHIIGLFLLVGRQRQPAKGAQNVTAQTQTWRLRSVTYRARVSQRWPHGARRHATCLPYQIMSIEHRDAEPLRRVELHKVANGPLATA